MLKETVPLTLSAKASRAVGTFDSNNGIQAPSVSAARMEVLKDNSDKSPRDAEFDVVVVGAGPTGLTLGCLLAKFGIKFCLIEKEKSQEDKFYGFGFIAIWHQTLDLLQLLDPELYDRFEKEGVTIDAAFVKTKTSGSNYNVPPRFAPICLGRWIQERILTDYLEKQAPGALKFNSQCVGVVQYQDVVLTTVEQKQEDGTVTSKEISSSWLVGCDGAHSTVRKMTGIAYQGKGLPHTFWMCYCDLARQDPEDPGPSRIVVQCPKGPLTGRIPLQANTNAVAVIVPFVKGVEEDTETGRPIIPTFENFITEIQSRDAMLNEFTNPLALNAFRCQFRLAANYRLDRVLLAGDSAHCHAPLGAQGGNLGMQDAFNLGWKLAARVRQGSFKDWLLDSYQKERRPVAQKIVNRVYRVQVLFGKLQSRFVMVASFLITSLSRLGGLGRRLAETLLANVNQMRIQYPKSMIASEDWHPPVSILDRLRGWWRPSAVHNRGCGAKVPNVVIVMADPRQREVSLYSLMDAAQWTVLFVDGANDVVEDDADWLAVSTQLTGTKVFGISIECRRLGFEEADTDKWIVANEEDTREKFFGYHSDPRRCCASVYLVRPDGYIAYRQTPVDADQLVKFLGEMSVN